MNTKKMGLLLAVMVIISMLCTGCTTGLTRSEKTGSDWSRGVLLGQTNLLDPVQLALTSSDTPILAWVDPSQGSREIRIQTMNRDGTPDENWVIDTPNAPTKLRLTPAAENKFHLFWVSANSDLLYALITDDGNTLTQLPLIEDAGDITYDVVALTDGSVAILWSAGEQGAFAVLISQNGERISDTQKLAITGYDIAAARTDDNLIHLTWLSNPAPSKNDIHYGVFDPESGLVQQEAIVASFSTTTGVVARQPAIALDSENAYVFWTRERRGGGMTPPMAETNYAWFPLGNPSNTAKTRVSLPTSRKPVYTISDPTLGLTFAPIQEGTSGSQFCYFPNTLQTPQETPLIAFAVQQIGRTTETIQIVTTAWQNGAPSAFQVAARTTAASQKPGIAVDSQGAWHLTWLDVGTSGLHKVYYTSTSEEAVAYLNKVRLDDIGRGIADTIWGLVQSLSFLPMAVVWFFPGLVIISLYLLIKADGDLNFNGPRIALGISCTAYIITKYLFRPSWLLDLPVPAFIGPTLADKIVLFGPIGMALLAAGVTIWYVRKKASASLLPGYAIFVIADAVLTMLLYVPGIFAE